MVVPAGSRVSFHSHTNEWLASGVLAAEYTLALRSEFEPLVGGGGSKVLNMLGGAVSTMTGNALGFSGSFKQMGFQIWKGTEPVNIQIEVDFTMSTNASVDVISPVRRLIKLPLPSEGVAGNLIPPGPSIIDALTGPQENQPPTSGPQDRSVEGYSYVNITIGGARIMGCIIISAEPTYSRFVDSNNIPISARVAIQAITMYSATKQAVGRWW